MKHSRNKLWSWLSATLLAGAIGGMGCGDNLELDVGTRDDTTPPGQWHPDNVEPIGPAFFIPDDNFPPNQASRFIANVNDPESLVLVPDNEEWLYWTGTTNFGLSIFGKRAIPGGQASVITRVAGGGLSAPLAAVPDEVYWSERGAVLGIHRPSGVVTPLYDIDAVVTALAVDRDGDYLFIGDELGRVFRAERGGGGEIVQIAAGTGQVFDMRVMLANESVVWATNQNGQGGNIYETRYGTLETVELGRGYNPTALMVDDDRVYWSDLSQRSIMGVDRLPGSEPYVISGPHFGIEAAVEDRFHIYFYAASTDLIYSVPKTGGAALALSSGITDVGNMGVGDEGLFFTGALFQNDTVFHQDIFVLGL